MCFLLPMLPSNQLSTRRFLPTFFLKSMSTFHMSMQVKGNQTIEILHVLCSSYVLPSVSYWRTHQWVFSSWPPPYHLQQKESFPDPLTPVYDKLPLAISHVRMWSKGNQTVEKHSHLLFRIRTPARNSIVDLHRFLFIELRKSWSTKIETNSRVKRKGEVGPSWVARTPTFVDKYHSNEKWWIHRVGHDSPLHSVERKSPVYRAWPNVVHRCGSGIDEKRPERQDQRWRLEQGDAGWCSTSTDIHLH